MKAFNSFEEMFATLEADAEAAKERAKTHHIKVEELRHGDFFMSPKDCGIVVFGEVVEHTEYPEDNEDIEMSRLNGYVFGRCYSVLCVEGELGDTHITSIVVKIPREVFERVKANGFKYLDFVDLVPFLV